MVLKYSEDTSKPPSKSNHVTCLIKLHLSTVTEATDIRRVSSLSIPSLDFVFSHDQTERQRSRLIRKKYKIFFPNDGGNKGKMMLYIYE